MSTKYIHSVLDIDLHLSCSSDAGTGMNLVSLMQFLDKQFLFIYIYHSWVYICTTCCLLSSSYRLCDCPRIQAIKRVFGTGPGWWATVPLGLAAGSLSHWTWLVGHCAIGPGCWVPEPLCLAAGSLSRWTWLLGPWATGPGWPPPVWRRGDGLLCCHLQFSWSSGRVLDS